MSDDDTRDDVANGAQDDDGLEFGDLREAVPASRRRPDKDRHYATVEVGKLAANDLPIFVELDVWRELIAHASHDTNVELGGVLLGGIFLDHEQRPFVLVTDSLRAEHYEATRGSFKFTHDTWESITRRREEFGGDTHMVGWYHTHPDWGVFLSSMDLFICDHFFGKPLDLALVLDPCRGDWGWFQWTGRRGEPPRRTGGFFLIAARNRQVELEGWAAIFSADGDSTMPADARWSSAPTPAGPSSPPVVHIHQPPGNLNQQTPLLIMVLLQTLLIALIGWRALTPTGGANSAHGDPAATDDSLRRWLAAERSQVKQEAQAELMDRVLGELAAAPDGAFHQLAELQEHNDELKGSLRAQQARERELVAEQASRAKQAERDQQSLQAKLADLTNQQTRLREQLDESNGKLAKVSARLKALAPDSDDSTGDEAGTLPWYRSPLTISGGAVVVVAALAAGWWSQQRRTRAADGAR